MERKIGAFLSELRRENGLTQKELAGMLHVSDKTVSRWERDEGTPDLFLVPVLAKLYGITSDEIIAGERSIREENGQRLSSESIPCEENRNALDVCTEEGSKLEETWKGCSCQGSEGMLREKWEKRARLHFEIFFALALAGGVGTLILVLRDFSGRQGIDGLQLFVFLETTVAFVCPIQFAVQVIWKLPWETSLPSLRRERAHRIIRYTKIVSGVSLLFTASTGAILYMAWNNRLYERKDFYMRYYGESFWFCLAKVVFITAGLLLLAGRIPDRLWEYLDQREKSGGREKYAGIRF